MADKDPFYLPETNETALHVLRDFLAPMAFAREIAHPREVGPAFARVRGHEMAKAALEMAVFELWARREGVPLWRVLGGRGGAIEAGVSVGLQEDEGALLDKVAAEVEAGYRRVKVKITPGRDVALVRALRERFPRLPLMVDANSAYALDDADRLLRARPLLAHHDRAAARLGRHRGPRPAAEEAPHPALPRRVDPLEPTTPGVPSTSGPAAS